MSIRPYRIEVSEAVLTDLRERLARVRWPAELPGTGWRQGADLPYLRSLCDYWRSGYDWRAHESRLNALPQFIAPVDGLYLHFIHVRGRGDNCLPLLLLHGWPGSIIEFEHLIGPLTDPAAHGAPIASPRRLMR